MIEPETEDQQPESLPRLIVGIGASAGGLEAFQTFLKNMPANSGMAFVVVQHLLPNRPSLLAELLARHTAMPVQEARHGVRIERDQVYVIPPNASLGIEDSRLRVIAPLGPDQHQTVIDRFFDSLAADQGTNAVCIILSGAGHEGTLGVKAIKEHGGLTLAQNVESAAHASMPRSAAAAGFVDLVLEVDKMPAALLRYADNLVRINGQGGRAPVRSSLSDHLERIYVLLRERQGHDFSKYKEDATLRRVRRRMQVLQLSDIGAYVERLEGDLAETDRLFRDLLIGVTRFFRDPAAFEALANRVVQALVAEQSAGERIRVWVPACGSGEEAYSIAILFLEAFAKLERQPQVQIFATDIDEVALASARAGLYSPASLTDMTKERVKRFFLREDGIYRVTKDLRATCMFAIQNVVSDPPFSRLDLISCRNLLIYLGSELQAGLLPLFHYALREEGSLFLGSSETIGRHTRLFAPIDRKHRIFRRRLTRFIPRPSFPADTFTQRSRELRDLAEKPTEISPSQWAERVMLAHYAPASILIDEHFEVVRFSARLAPFLDPSAGNATLNVFGLIHPELRMELRAALQKARQSRATVRQQAIRVHGKAGESGLVDLIVEPRVSAGGNNVALFLIILRERETLGDASKQVSSVADREASVGQLEQELDATRERLQTSIEQLETLNEELSSSNEELLTANEELQSSNEELEASQEELQSLNEELETVNSELRDKVDELDRAHNDLLNLLDSTSIATLFLDTDLRIKRFTPSLSGVISVRHGDEGRPIGDFALKFEYPQLLEDVHAVVRGGPVREVEIARSEDGRVYLLRIAPYRTTEQAIEGGVLTFVDISRIKKAEQRLLTYRQRAEVAIAASRGGLYEHAVPPGPDTYYSERWIQVLGYVGGELPEPNLFREWLVTHAHPDDRAGFVEAYERLVHGEIANNDVQVRLQHKQGHWVWVRHVCQPVERDPAGHPSRVAGLMFDVSAERAAADELRQTLEHLRLALDAGRMGMWQWDLERDRVVWDQQTFVLLGFDPDDIRPSVRRLLEAVHPEDRDELRRAIDQVVGVGEPYNTEFRIMRPDGGIRWLRGLGQAQRDTTGRTVRLIGVMLDTTEGRRRASAERASRPPPGLKPRQGTGTHRPRP